MATPRTIQDCRERAARVHEYLRDHLDQRCTDVVLPLQPPA